MSNATASADDWAPTYGNIVWDLDKHEIATDAKHITNAQESADQWNAIVGRERFLASEGPEQ